jgi:surface antigen
MRVTSLTGRLAVAAGALGITALTAGLTGAGIAAASVASTERPAAASPAGSLPGGNSAAGSTGTRAAATAAARVIARAAGTEAGHLSTAAAGPAAARHPAGLLPPIPVKLTMGRWPGTAGTRAAAKYYGYPYPHPPACTDGGACSADKWAFYRGQCTSWVAYRLNERAGTAFTNYYGGAGRWGDAVHWKKQATALKITVNPTPSAGAIAWYAATKAAPDGHVAYVESVTSPASFVMSEMNYDADNGFWVHAIAQRTGDWPTEFIHFTAISPR